uniref:30S ribosomal protein S9, chloroplastic n=1 Tax=Aureoumbra lagunensis TaxID=44058 RepID=A0A7S3NHT6_9STRA|mmetsp:Transcript_19570/g.25334  ORF Transcript_19570/g.25334 Transcript_19570/m.25334 type:complete len:196 (+) Transcript_19570:41-628(+)
MRLVSLIRACRVIGNVNTPFSSWKKSFSAIAQGINTSNLNENESEQQSTRLEQKTKTPIVYVKKVDELGRAYGTGGRKCAVARVWIYPGTGRFTVNSMSLIEYFPRIAHCEHIIEPFHCTETSCDFDVYSTTKGGGKSGQAGALRLGIARALQNYNPSFRPRLKQFGLLTRDSRIVERKKPGLKKARKAKQWVKR